MASPQVWFGNLKELCRLWDTDKTKKNKHCLLSSLILRGSNNTLVYVPGILKTGNDDIIVTTLQVRNYQLFFVCFEG